MRRFFQVPAAVRSCLMLAAMFASIGQGADIVNYRPATDPFFPTPSYFRNHFGAPPEQVQLAPPARFEQYLRDGRLVLSLKNYLDLVMANNADIAVQRIQVETYANAITRAFSVFDPLANASFQTGRVKSPSNTSLNGAATLNTLTQPLNLSFQQKVVTGGTYSISFDNTKFSTNSAFATYNPSYSQNLSLNFSQPLLRGRGIYITKLPITIARSRIQQSAFVLQDQVTQLIANAESAYWDVVEARENVSVQEDSLKLADASLKRTQREIELGATSPLDVYQPQQQYASAQLALEQARHNVIQVENTLRREMGADLDLRVKDAPLDLTESPKAISADIQFEANDVLKRAFSTRFDLKGLRQGVNVDDLYVAQAKDAMKPSLALTLNYSSAGLGGPFYERQSILDPNGNPATIVSVLPGGPGDALNQLFRFGYPAYTVGLNLTLPIRDHNATANLADALTNRKTDQYRIRSAEETIRMQVLNALTAIDRSKASITLATKVRDLAQQRVDAEQKKYDLGTTTIFFVLAAQSDLTVAESQLVHESINLRRNLLSLYQSTGELLEQRGVQVETP